MDTTIEGSDIPSEELIVPHERANAYISLSNQLSQAYNWRRSLEWKIHIALWTLLAASGYAYLRFNPDFGIKALVPILIILVPFVFLHLVCSIKLHRSENKEQKLSIEFRKKAEAILERGGDDQPKDEGLNIKKEKTLDAPPSRKKCFEGYWWWLVIEVSTTIIIAIVIVFLATSSPRRISEDQVKSLQTEVESLHKELTKIQQNQHSLYLSVEVIRQLVFRETVSEPDLVEDDGAKTAERPMSRPK